MAGMNLSSISSLFLRGRKRQKAYGPAESGEVIPRRFGPASSGIPRPSTQTAIKTKFKSEGWQGAESD